jgi:transcriptional regulator with XRE-family HTH domain
MVPDRWLAQRETLGAFIREQRKRANLSLRQLAEKTSLSNPYLSQVERGLHQPSVRVLRAISDALNLSAETLLAQAGLIDVVVGAGQDQDEAVPELPQTEHAIRADERLTEEQKAALLAVYRSMLVLTIRHGPNGRGQGLSTSACGEDAAPSVRQKSPDTPQYGSRYVRPCAPGSIAVVLRASVNSAVHAKRPLDMSI